MPFRDREEAELITKRRRIEIIAGDSLSMGEMGPTGSFIARGTVRETYQAVTFPLSLSHVSGEKDLRDFCSCSMSVVVKILDRGSLFILCQPGGIG